jgi:hypothetical protein
MTTTTKRIISRVDDSVPADDKIIHFGKYKGKPMSALLNADDWYLRFLLTKTSSDFAVDVKSYLQSKGIEMEQ